MATMKEQIAQEVARAVSAGKAVAVETVDFSDPNRPKTCLEVDFPLLPINQIAAVESSSGAATKPVYQMAKWWARRPSSVFRSLLIAAATKAPDDLLQTSKVVWENYFANFQKKGAFSNITVADIFMGGGTTIVEGSRLGMKMLGNDLNPVAWFVVKQELADVSTDEVARLLVDIESEVKPQLMPFYYCDGPNGEKGVWTHRLTGKVMGAEFDPLNISYEDRQNYSYDGPEAIYTFWAKHGPCQMSGCGHRTPIMTSSVMAVKSLTVKCWEHTCKSCGSSFDIEDSEARMAPDVPLFISPEELPYAILDQKGRVTCPSCGHVSSSKLGKSKNKKIELSLLVHPDWLAGSGSKSTSGEKYGGSAKDSAESSALWTIDRCDNLRLLEVRGTLPDEVECPETGTRFGPRDGTVPKKSHFTCGSCGAVQDVLDSVRLSAKTGPIAAYAIQAFSPNRSKSKAAYSGRFFAPFGNLQARQHAALMREWEVRKDKDLSGFWPRSELPYGFMTHHLQGGVPNHGFTHWWTMFNQRQLLVHSLLMKAIIHAGGSAHKW